jgi:hypothetical protein
MEDHRAEPTVRRIDPNGNGGLKFPPKVPRLLYAIFAEYTDGGGRTHIASRWKREEAEELVRLINLCEPLKHPKIDEIEVPPQ